MNNNRFSYINEPPRKVPISLRMFSIFSGVTSMALFYQVVFWGALVLFYVKRDIAKCNINMYIYCIIVIVLEIGLVFLVLTSIYKGIRNIVFLKYGKLTFAELKEKKKTIIRSSGSPTVILTFIFKYSVKDKEYIHIYKPQYNKTKLLEDEGKEPILYLEKNPEKALLLDSLHSRINLDIDGNFKLDKPILGFFFLFVDLILIFILIGITIILINGGLPRF
ncbi:MAG: hypothetical protein ABH873_03655 [Candidatus Firestonebacteria bacterium]